VESLWAVGGSPASRRYARHALGHLLPAIEAFVNAPDAASARAMAIGSHLAGRAINVSKTTAAHALSYGITKRYGLSHGHAVAMTLGAFIETHATAPAAALQPAITPERHAEAMELVLGALGAADPADARDRFVGLAGRLGLTMGLGEIGAGDPIAIKALAATVNAERLGNNPIRFDEAGLVEILDRSR